jgi:hypothetical protein
VTACSDGAGIERYVLGEQIELRAGGYVRKGIVAVLIMPGMLLASCATLMKGRTEDITVVSDPPGATVLVNGQQKGVTPVVVNVPSKTDLDVYVTKNGYRPEDLSDPATTRWSYETFSLVCGVLPVFADMGTGAAWGHDHLMVSTHLEPLPGTNPQAGKGESAELEQAMEGSPYVIKPAPSPAAKASPSAH